MRPLQAKFHLGQVIRYRLFDYRGVVVDVDAMFQGNDDWYDQVAKSRPPKDKPWYRVLVHEVDHETYVADRRSDPKPHDQRLFHGPRRHRLSAEVSAQLRPP